MCCLEARAYRAQLSFELLIESLRVVSLQQALRAGEVPGIHACPGSCHLEDFGGQTIATE